MNCEDPNCWICTYLTAMIRESKPSALDVKLAIARDREAMLQEQAEKNEIPKVESSLCPCGAELMGNLAKRVNLKCGDCAMAEAIPGRPRASLDQRIAKAQPPKVDKDPTEAWGAGATANWEWP